MDTYNVEIIEKDLVNISLKTIDIIYKDDVLPINLTSTNDPIDGYVPKYDVATGKFTWVLSDTISDADGDTKIQCEKNLDEDIIRFTVAGNEKIALDNIALYPSITEELDLGKATRRFKDLYLKGSSIYLGTNVLTVNGGALELDGQNISGDVTYSDLNPLKDNILINAFRISVLGSFPKYNMIDGIMDEFEDESGIDTVSSINEIYDSNGDYYIPYSTFGDATGGIITHDGLYTVHTFISNGTFTPLQSDNIEILVVGGGGSGGKGGGAGGGAGGIAYNASFAVTAQGYAVVIGAGGASQNNIDATGNVGSDSTFSTLTGQGGGYGGAYNGKAGGNGGCGGGGGRWNGAGGIGSQGKNGGVGSGSGSGNGGGGGMGYNGVAGSGEVGGDGGDGIRYSISGTQTYYAGGGGGGSDSSTVGAGGQGGGGVGIGSGDPQSHATPNTGGGGGGSIYQTSSGAGGSGIVIIRYLTPIVETFNMTLISKATEAEENPDNVRLVLMEEDLDVVTINTDLKAYASRDDGANWSQAILSLDTDIGSGQKVYAGTADVSGQASDKTIKWKIQTFNTKSLKLHGIGALWD